MGHLQNRYPCDFSIGLKSNINIGFVRIQSELSFTWMLHADNNSGTNQVSVYPLSTEHVRAFVDILTITVQYLQDGLSNDNNCCPYSNIIHHIYLPCLMTAYRCCLFLLFVMLNWLKGSLPIKYTFILVDSTVHNIF